MAARSSAPKTPRTPRVMRAAAGPAVLLVTPPPGGAALEGALRAQGWSVEVAANTRAATRQLAASTADAAKTADVAVLPQLAETQATVALLERLRRAAPALRCIVLLRRGRAGIPAELAGAGAHALLPPPVTPRKLVAAIRREWARLTEERVALLRGRAPSQALRDLAKERVATLREENRSLRQTLRENGRRVKALTVLNESLRIQSTTDPLTGLYNRREFLNRIRTEWGRFRRHRHPLSLIMLDIDHFKRINDTYGHECGDTVLRGLGQLISRHKRAHDVCCRYGGEEFVVLLTETSLEHAFHVGEGLRRLVARHRFSYKGQSIQVQVSLGLAGAMEQNLPDVETFINMADKAMYRAKREGRDRTVVLDAEDESRIARQSPRRPRAAPRAAASGGQRGGRRGKGNVKAPQ